MHIVKAVLDTGAGPNIIHEKVLSEEWKMRLTQQNTPKITDASRNRMLIKGSVLLCLRVGDLRIRTRFLVASNLAVDCILGTAFIDRYVKAIIPRGRKILLKYGKPIALDGIMPGPDSDAKRAAKIPKQTVSNKIRVAKSVVIPPMEK